MAELNPTPTDIVFIVPYSRPLPKIPAEQQNTDDEESSEDEVSKSSRNSCLILKLMLLYRVK
jgi:hypothetical protein